jgi:hypothetical protein
MVYAEPFPEFYHPLLMAEGAEVAVPVGECQKILMAAVILLHSP